MTMWKGWVLFATQVQTKTYAQNALTDSLICFPCLFSFIFQYGHPSMMRITGSAVSKCYACGYAQSLLSPQAYGFAYICTYVASEN